MDTKLPPSEPPRTPKTNAGDLTPEVEKQGETQTSSVETPKKGWIGWIVGAVFIRPVLSLARVVGFVAPEKTIADASVTEANPTSNPAKKGRKRKAHDQSLIDPSRHDASVHQAAKHQTQLQRGLNRQGVTPAEARLKAQQEIQINPLATIEGSLPAESLGQSLTSSSTPLHSLVEKPLSEESSEPQTASPENVDSTEVLPIGFTNVGGSCFASANMKALMVAYPDSYFQEIRKNQFTGPKESVRAAFVELLDIARGRIKNKNKNIEPVLRKLYKACHALSAGEREGFHGMFTAAGGATPSDGPDFLNYLMEVLGVHKLKKASAAPLKQWHFKLTKDDGGNLLFTSSVDKQRIEVERNGLLALNVQLGDEGQSVQSCLDLTLDSAPPPQDYTPTFSLNELEAKGYKSGDVATMDTGFQFQAKVPLQPEAEKLSLYVDIEDFSTLGLTLKLTNPFAFHGQPRMGREAAAIGRNTKEELMVPVTDNQTGIKYQVNMRLKSVSYHNGGHYSAGLREADGKWRCHDDSNVSQVFDHPSKIGDPLILFYERVGDPVLAPEDVSPVLPSADPAQSLSFLSTSDNDTGSETNVSDQETDSDRVSVSGSDYSPDEILDAHCDLAVSSPSDEVAETNRTLFKALSQYSLTGQKLTYDRRKESESARMLSGRPDDVPLLESENEFRRLFSGVPWQQRKDIQKMARALTYFKKMSHLKRRENDPRWSAIPADYFPHMLARGHLDYDLTAPRRGDRVDGADKAFTRVLSAENDIVKHIDFPVADRTVEDLAAKGVVPHDAGLYNFGQNCYMNASLQSMAYGLFNAPQEMLKLKTGTIPFNVAFDLIEREYPSSRKLTDDEKKLGKDDREELQQQLSRVRSEAISVAAREAIAGKGEYAKRFNQFKEYYDFRRSFIVLIEALNTGEYCPEINELQKQFFRSYLNFAQQAGLFTSQNFFGEGVTAENLVPTQLKQMDASEFIGEMCLLLGWKTDPGSAVLVSSAFELEHEGKAVYRKPANVLGVKEIHSIVAMSMKDVSAEEMSLQAVVDKFLQPEPTEEGKDAYKGWTDTEYEESGIPKDQRSQAKTNKVAVLKCIGSEPPATLMLNTKLFDFVEGRLEKNVYIPPKEIKLEEHALALLSSIDDHQTVDIPMTLMSAPEASVSAAKPVTRQYKVSSIVMHMGDSLKSGHYVTIRFEDGQAYICDDEKVLTVEDYCKYHDIHPAFTSWKEYCVENALRPYVFNLQDASLPRIAPPITQGKLSDVTVPVQPSMIEWSKKIVAPAGAPEPVESDKILLVSGDITRLKDQWGIEVDGVVNAANGELRAGSGVCGAIFDAAGSGKVQLQKDCGRLNGCKTGQAKTTEAYDLRAQGVKKIIHAVGPDLRDTGRYQSSSEKASYELKCAYQSALVQAMSHGLKTVAIPALSTGVYGFPAEEGMQIAVNAIREVQDLYPDAPGVVFVTYPPADASAVQQDGRLHDFARHQLQTPYQSPFTTTLEATGESSDYRITMDSAPEIWSSDLDDSLETSIDFTVNTNHDLYKALHSVPLDPAASDTEGWGAWGWRTFFTDKSYRPPVRLVTRRDEFIQLFSKVPLGFRADKHTMITAVRNFKKLRASDPFIIPEMFAELLKRGELASTSDGHLKTNSHQALAVIKGIIDFPVVNPNAGLLLREADSYNQLPGFQGGLISNSMKTMLHMLRSMKVSNAQLNELKGMRIPESVAYKLMNQVVPEEGRTTVARRRVVNQALKKAYENGEDVYHYEPFNEFKQAYIHLISGLAQPYPEEPLKKQLKHFIESYQQLCVKMGEPEAAERLRSPAQMLKHISECLGLDHHEKYALEKTEIHELSVPGAQPIKKAVRSEQSSVIALPVTSRMRHQLTGTEQDAYNPSLQMCVIDHLAPEEIRPDAEKWESEDYTAAGITGDNQHDRSSKTSAMFKCNGRQPPKRVNFQLIKPRECWGMGEGLTSDSHFSRQVGIVMNNTSMDAGVTLPVMNKDEEVASLNYKVKSLVCQRPDGNGGGHTLALHFEGDKIWVCDDATEIELHEFVNYRGEKPGYISWQDFCVDQNLVPCTVSLEADDKDLKAVQWHKDKTYSEMVDQVRTDYGSRKVGVDVATLALREKVYSKQLLDNYRQSLEAAKKGPDPIHIDLVTPVTSGKGTPGFENYGNTCYVNASLVGFIESLSDEQLDGIVARIDGMDMSAAQNVARGFVNLTRAYRAGATPKETEWAFAETA